jgi:hypothetical protein
MEECVYYNKHRSVSVKYIYIYISIEAFYIVELASFKSCQTVRKLQKKNAVVWGVVHTLGISSNS